MRSGRIIARITRVAISPLLVLLATTSASATTVITSDTALTEDLLDDVIIAADDVTLDCGGFSIIGFPPFTGVQLSARSGVTIENCKVSGFLTGIRAEASSLELIDTTVEGAVLNGLDVIDNSRLAVTGALTLRDNGVFAGFLANNTSVTVSDAVVTIDSNANGLQLGLNSSLFVVAFPPVPPSKILAQDNGSFGLTVTSNAHLFLFGAADVVSRRNKSNGISVFSKSAIELDNGATITAENNAEDGILLEDSTLNLFNMDDFSGSRLTLRNNGLTGLNVGKLSVFDMGDDATLLSEGNPIGLRLDDGSSGRIRASTLTGNGQDLVLSFGARADLDGNTIGSVSCDGTVLVRRSGRPPRLCPEIGE